MITLKIWFFTLAVLAVLLFSTGLISVKKDGYACAGGWQVGFAEREQIFHYGSLHVYAYPFLRECPEERRYDPDNVQSCILTGFCTLPESDDEVGETN